MRDSFLPPNQRWYAGKEFEWTELSFGTFYQSMYKKMKPYAYKVGYVNGVENFDDIFQETMISFFKLKGDKVITFNSYRGASWLVKRIFYFAIINDYRRYKNWRHSPLPDDDSAGNEDSINAETDTEPLDKKVGIFFSEVDKLVASHPKLMTCRQLEFYNLYKVQVLKPVSDHDIKELISDKMLITSSYYQVLKSQVNAILENLIHKMNFVTR